MFNQRLPEFNQVAASKTSQLRIPKYALTLKKIMLVLGGTVFTKALITEIRLKLGSKTIYQVAGGDLDTINQYRGIFNDAYHLSIDFSERDAKDIVAEELGGIDLSKLNNDDLYLEVDIGAATAPTLYAMAWFTPPQGDSNDPRQLMRKIVKVNYSAGIAGKNSMNFNPMGALLTRVYTKYTGTDWTTSANGNVTKTEVKKNGLIVNELLCLDARFAQQEYRRVPQSKLHVVDFIVDNNMSGALVTSDAKALEFNQYCTAADTLTVYFEVLDKPYNL